METVGALLQEPLTRIEASCTVAPTAAMSAVYAARGATLDDLASRVRCRPGQRGAVAFVGGRFAALDWLSSEDVYADLHPRLVRGYALDAADAPPGAPAPSRRQVEALLAQVMSLPLEPTLHAAPSAGRPPRAPSAPDGRPLHTSALALDQRLAHLSVLADE